MKTTEQQIAETPSLQATDNYSVRERQWRAPSVPDGEEIIFDEPGRVLNRGAYGPGGGNAVCCRSHYFRVTKAHSFYILRVKHGGGEEQCSLKYDKRIIDALALMDSDSRFWMLWAFMDVKKDAEIATREAVNAKWQAAAAQKRIKTRKMRDGVKVWIVPAITLENYPV